MASSDLSPQEISSSNELASGKNLKSKSLMENIKSAISDSTSFSLLTHSQVLLHPQHFLKNCKNSLDSVNVSFDKSHQAQGPNLQQPKFEVLNEFSRNVEKRNQKNSKDLKDKSNGKKIQNNTSKNNTKEIKRFSRKKNSINQPSSHPEISRKWKGKKGSITNAKRRIDLDGGENLVRKKVHTENLNQSINEGYEPEAFNFIKILDVEDNESKELDSKSTSPTCTEAKLEIEDDNKTNNVGTGTKVNRLRLDSKPNNSLSQKVSLVCFE